MLFMTSLNLCSLPTYQYPNIMDGEFFQWHQLTYQSLNLIQR